MATVEKRSNRFRLIFYFQGNRYASSLKTTDKDEADDIAGSVNRTLTLMQQGVVGMPEGADLVTFVLSGGKKEDKPKLPPIRTLTELKDRYLQAVGVGAMEDNSLDSVRMHLKHFVKTLGAIGPDIKTKKVVFTYGNRAGADEAGRRCSFWPRSGRTQCRSSCVRRGVGCARRPGVIPMTTSSPLPSSKMPNGSAPSGVPIS